VSVVRGKNEEDLVRLKGEGRADFKFKFLHEKKKSRKVAPRKLPADLSDGEMSSWKERLRKCHAKRIREKEI